MNADQSTASKDGEGCGWGCLGCGGCLVVGMILAGVTGWWVLGAYLGLFLLFGLAWLAMIALVYVGIPLLGLVILVILGVGLVRLARKLWSWRSSKKCDSRW